MEVSFKDNIDNVEIGERQYYEKVLLCSVNIPFVVCISAGERKTGGYDLSLNNISINKDNFQIFIDLFLKVPAKGEMVTQAFTYPSIAVEINEVLDVGEWEVIVTVDQKNGEPLLLRKSFTFSN
ncbi:MULTISPECIES: protease complex subunit PrcB family protein [Petrotoga]|uniref:protease complex subunit PrcB family protein n=1 Tax=Petrotoga TaxID=28236 RepID=UPI000CA06E12